MDASIRWHGLRAAPHRPAAFNWVGFLLLLPTAALALTWNPKTDAPPANVGLDNARQLDSAGNPHISYHDTAGGDLMYAAWNGTGWDVETVDSTGQVGWYTALALDSAGNPHISYYDITNSDLKYAAWNGTGWDVETVDSAGQVGWYTALALDLSLIHI